MVWRLQETRNRAGLRRAGQRRQQGRQQALSVLWLDLNATDDPLHGAQEGRFFHGYYKSCCYLPLYIFCGEHLLCARLRPTDRDAAAGSTDELARLIGQVRQRWPQVDIIVRGDSGFSREELMVWCEAHEVGYPAKGANPRFVVTNPDKQTAGARVGFNFLSHKIYGIFSHMEAVLLYRDKYIYRDGAIREMVIWQLAEQDLDYPHRLKYRLFYGYPGNCLVRYDNERGKGDHRHYDDREEAYEWVSVTQLVVDFKADIEKLRGEQDE